MTAPNKWFDQVLYESYMIVIYDESYIRHPLYNTYHHTFLWPNFL